MTSTASPYSPPAAETPSVAPRRSGISLAALCVGLTLLGVLAALVLPPQFMGARKEGNESLAIATLKQIGAAQTAYRESRGAPYYYAEDFRQLQRAGFLPQEWSRGSDTRELLRGGYRFRLTRAEGETGCYVWTCTAEPEVPAVTGDRAFGIDMSGIVAFSWFEREGPIEYDTQTAQVLRGNVVSQ